MRRAGRIAGSLPFGVDLDEIVMGRAAITGLSSNGRISANGSCRLLPTVDGWVAVNLSRSTDLDALPAVLEADVDTTDPWNAVGNFAGSRRAGDVAERFQLLGTPAAVLDDPTVDGSRAVVSHRLGDGAVPGSPTVVDLTSMWAGPLCAHLLGRSGMRVVKVESTTRPDGARSGDPRFYEWLHAGHELRRIDITTDAGRAELRRLIDGADVVLESSRPRALAQLGVDAAEVVASRPGRVWVSITGYGRSGAAADRVAFGDDAAVAGGLVGRDDEGLPVFCADAVADPMSGLTAAAATFRSLEGGGGHLIDVAMAAVCRYLAHGGPDPVPNPALR